MGGHVNVTQYIIFRAGPTLLEVTDKEGRQAIDIAKEEPKVFLQQVSPSVASQHNESPLIARALSLP